MATDKGASAALAMVPYSGDVAPSAGGSEDVVIGPESVIAYFQFIQNNVQRIASGNADAARNEAGQRHREVMQSTISA